jgi:hypothetical protein
MRTVKVGVCDPSETPGFGPAGDSAAVPLMGRRLGGVRVRR